MANSGFVSIGHLLFGEESSDHDRISILREVCKKFSANFTLALNGADCIYRFDLFFGSVKPTVESFHKVSLFTLRHQSGFCTSNFIFFSF